MTGHKCYPKEKVVAFFRTCAVCGKEIEPVFCQPCEGTGAEFASVHTDRNCRFCKGTGVIQWKEVNP